MQFKSLSSEGFLNYSIFIFQSEKSLKHTNILMFMPNKTSKVTLTNYDECKAYLGEEILTVVQFEGRFYAYDFGFNLPFVMNAVDPIKEGTVYRIINPDPGDEREEVETERVTDEGLLRKLNQELHSE